MQKMVANGSVNSAIWLVLENTIKPQKDGMLFYCVKALIFLAKTITHY